MSGHLGEGGIRGFIEQYRVCGWVLRRGLRAGNWGINWGGRGVGFEVRLGALGLRELRG